MIKDQQSLLVVKNCREEHLNQHHQSCAHHLCFVVYLDMFVLVYSTHPSDVAFTRPQKRNRFPLSEMPRPPTSTGYALVSQATIKKNATPSEARSAMDVREKSTSKTFFSEQVTFSRGHEDFAASLYLERRRLF